MNDCHHTIRRVRLLPLILKAVSPRPRAHAPRHTTNGQLLAPLIAAIGLCAAGSASAAIVYDDFGGMPYNFSATASATYLETTLLTLDLPGDANLKFNRFTFTGTPNANYLNVFLPSDALGRVASGLVSFLNLAQTLASGETWTDGLFPNSNYFTNLSYVGRLSPYTVGNLLPDPSFVPFYFQDTTDATRKYGYLNLTTFVTGSGVDSVLNLRIVGYGYDSSGARIAMGALPGAVPVPATLALLPLGLFGIGVVTRRRRAASAATA